MTTLISRPFRRLSFVGMGLTSILFAGCFDLDNLSRCWRGEDGKGMVPADCSMSMDTPLGAISNLMASAPAHNKVVLTWTGVDGVATYRVERALSAGGQFMLLADSVSGAVQSYDDTSVVEKTLYRYRVTAVRGAEETVSNVAQVTTPASPPVLPRFTPGTDRCDAFSAFQARDASDNDAVKKMLCLPRPMRTASGTMQGGQSVAYDTIDVGSLVGKAINAGTMNGTVMLAPAQKLVYVVAKGIGATPLDVNEFANKMAPFGAPTRTTSNFSDGQVIEPSLASVMLQTAGSSGSVVYASIVYDPSDDSIVGAKPLAKGVAADGTTPIPDTGVVR